MNFNGKAQPVGAAVARLCHVVGTAALQASRPASVVFGWTHAPGRLALRFSAQEMTATITEATEKIAVG